MVHYYGGDCAARRGYGGMGRSSGSRRASIFPSLGHLRRPCHPRPSIIPLSLPISLSPPLVTLEISMSKSLSWVALAAALVVGPEQACCARWSTTASMRQADTPLSFVATPFLPRLFQRARAMTQSNGGAPARAQMMTVIGGKADGERVILLSGVTPVDHAGGVFVCSRGNACRVHLLCTYVCGVDRCPQLTTAGSHFHSVAFKRKTSWWCVLLTLPPCRSYVLSRSESWKRKECDMCAAVRSRLSCWTACSRSTTASGCSHDRTLAFYCSIITQQRFEWCVYVAAALSLFFCCSPLILSVRWRGCLRSLVPLAEYRKIPRGPQVALDLILL